jgi:hypothetical protein
MKKIILLTAIAFASFSCNTDDSNLDDENFINSPQVIGFSGKFETVAYFADEGAVSREFPIDVINLGSGNPNGEDITVTYSVDPASTAVEGQEYSFLDNSRQVVIPAGGSFGKLPLTINTGQLNPTMKTQLIINLTAVDKDGFVIAEQQKQFKVIFVGCQSQLAGTYTVVVTRNDGIVRTYLAETVDLVSVNYFKTRTTGTWAAGALPVADQGYNFTDICGDITVAEQGLAQGAYSNVVKGLTTDGTDGFVTDNNNFQVKYEISFAAGNRTYTNVYTRSN